MANIVCEGAMNSFCNPSESFRKNPPDQGTSLPETSVFSKPIPNQSCLPLAFGTGAQLMNHAYGAIGNATGQKPDHIDDEEMALKEEMQKLNLGERIQADQTVLGNTAVGIKLEVRNGRVFEDTNQMSLKFQELANTINRIEYEMGNKSYPEYEAYKLARDKDPKYVTCNAFTKGFLRAEQYDAEKAAHRMFRHLKNKLDLFGKEKLTRDILLEDIGDDGLRYLERGGLQVLPKRDAAGRRVVFTRGVLNGSSSKKDIESARKAFFYFWTSISEDDNEQGRIKGIAGILWRVHRPPVPSAFALRSLVKIWMNVPLRISAYHICYGPKTNHLDSFDRFAKICIGWFVNKTIMRLRRAHFGETLEIMYEMMDKYNMPSEYFPINGFASLPSNTGQSNNDTEHSTTAALFHTYYHEKWIEYRRLKDGQKRILITAMRTSIGSESMNANSSVPVEQQLIDSMDDPTDFSMTLGNDAMIGGTSTIKNDSVDASKLAVYTNDDSAGHTENIMTTLFTNDANLESVHKYLNESHLLSEGLLVGSQRIVRGDRIAKGDIKLGQGRPLQHHPGNEWLRNLISAEFENYDSLDRRGQTGLSREIVQQIKNEGRRFWRKLDNDLWIEIDDTAARKKIAVSFRTERKKRVISH